MDPKLPIRSLDYTVIFARDMPAMWLRAKSNRALRFLWSVA